MQARRVVTMALAIVMFSFMALPTSAQSSWNIAKTFSIGGDGGWDYLKVDSVTHRLFVTRGTHTQVIDTESGKVLADIPGQTQAHGIALVSRLNRGFITDGGGTGSILIFDLTTYQVLGKLAALPDVDAMIYDAGDDRILVASGDGNALITFRPDVDPKTGKIDPPIKLGGAPESLTSDGKGKAYINLEDKNEVAVVDLKARKVTSLWPVIPGGHPVGIAMDAASHKLFVGCRNPQKLIIMNSENGKIEGSLPIGVGIDGTAFSSGQVFVSCGDGSLAIASSKLGKFDMDQVVKTKKGSRTLAVDGASRRIYLPTADFEPVTTGWPKVKPGTFAILVLLSN